MISQDGSAFRWGLLFDAHTRATAVTSSIHTKSQWHTLYSLVTLGQVPPWWNNRSVCCLTVLCVKKAGTNTQVCTSSWRCHVLEKYLVFMRDHALVSLFCEAAAAPPPRSCHRCPLRSPAPRVLDLPAALAPSRALPSCLPSNLSLHRSFFALEKIVWAPRGKQLRDPVPQVSREVPEGGVAPRH